MILQESGSRGSTISVQEMSLAALMKLCYYQSGWVCESPGLCELFPQNNELVHSSDSWLMPRNLLLVLQTLFSVHKSPRVY